MSKHTPCDSGDCPFDAQGGMDCRNYCGLGVDESGPPDDSAPTDHEHVYSRHHQFGGICKSCGAAMPDPPEDSPPPYDHP